MFTASELLEKINSHIADLQFIRTPKGLYDPVTYVLSMGGKTLTSQTLCILHLMSNQM